MLPACRPNSADAVQTTQKAEQACFDGLINSMLILASLVQASRAAFRLAFSSSLPVWPPLGARLPMLGTLPVLFNVLHQFPGRFLTACIPSARKPLVMKAVTCEPSAILNSSVWRTYGCGCDGTDIAFNTLRTGDADLRF